MNKKTYATSKDGVNYRDIADSMTINGHVMNHSSARNHILRIMTKFASAINNRFELGLKEEKLKEIAFSSSFQKTIIDLINDVIDKKHPKKL